MKSFVLLVMTILFLTFPLGLPTQGKAAPPFDSLAEDAQNAIELAELSLELQTLLQEVFNLMNMRFATAEDRIGDSESPPTLADNHAGVGSSWDDEQSNAVPNRSSTAVAAQIPNTSVEDSSASSEDHYGLRRSYQIGAEALAMRLVPASEFPHGSFDQAHQSYMPFWVAETEVTYALWYEIYHWALANGYNLYPARAGSAAEEYDTFPGSDRTQPAVHMTWVDALIWCNALSEYLNLIPVYHYSRGVIRSTDAFFQADETVMAVETEGFRIPNEIEWHLAARYAGNQSHPGSIAMGSLHWHPRNWASGADADITDADAVQAVAWVASNSSTSQPVGQLRPNALGLYDMTGNASEWIFHQYGHIASTRGGSFFHDLRMVGVGDQSHNFPYYNAYSYVGFRLARSDFSHGF